MTARLQVVQNGPCPFRNLWDSGTALPVAGRPRRHRFETVPRLECLHHCRRPDRRPGTGPTTVRPGIRPIRQDFPLCPQHFVAFCCEPEFKHDSADSSRNNVPETGCMRRMRPEKPPDCRAGPIHRHIQGEKRQIRLSSGIFPSAARRASAGSAFVVSVRGRRAQTGR